MKTLTEKQALVKLSRLKEDYRRVIREGYETRAKDCRTCKTQGACCLDAHFVNVHITRLEAAAVRRVLEEDLDQNTRRKVYRRAADAVERYGLEEEKGGDPFSKTYACPLFEPGAGCLVHQKAKPAPCIQHACYENKADLPPDRLLTRTETRIERLNTRVYANAWNWLPLPVWLKIFCGDS